MNIEIILYPLLLAAPGIVWLVIQFRSYHAVAGKERPCWQWFKLILSIVLIMAVSGMGGYLVVGSMMGPSQDGFQERILISSISAYLATSYLMGRWIKSTRLGNYSVSIAFAATVIYFVFINPVLIVKPLADTNIANAQYLMGYFYETGTGGVRVKHEGTAGIWYGKAAKHGGMRATRAAVRLLPAKHYDRVALLKVLAAHEPDGEIYNALWESTFFMPYSSEIEREQEAEKWLLQAAEYGHRDAILRVMSKYYSLEVSCRLSPKSDAALPEFEKWVRAYEKTRGNPGFDEKELQSLKEKADCLAKKIAEAKVQDAQLVKYRQAIFSADVNTYATALETIKQMGPRAITAIPELLKLAHSRDYARAWHALGTIVKVDPEGEIATKLIVAMLSHRSPHIRVNGAYGVGLYADKLPDAITQLDQLLDDPDNDVAGRAALALSEYGGLAKASLQKIDALKKRRDSRLSSYASQACSKIMRDKGSRKKVNRGSYTIRF